MTSTNDTLVAISISSSVIMTSGRHSNLSLKVFFLLRDEENVANTLKTLRNSAFYKEKLSCYKLNLGLVNFRDSSE